MSEVTSASAPGQEPKERFFRYFQLEATALRHQMACLETLSNIGVERIDAINHCLAGIARLQKEVQDASLYTTAYDHRIYSEGIKALHEKLEKTRATIAPKSKFTFKSSSKKNDSAISLSDASDCALQQKAKLDRHRQSPVSSGESSNVPTPATNISAHSSTHIIVPSSAAAAAATSSGSITNLHHCVVDMYIPTTTGQPFAGLTIKHVKQSLLVCGNVSGAAHVTDVEDSVIVVTTRQFRMHQCRNCIVYLNVSSKPIIEDCTGIRFAPLPKEYLHDTKDAPENNEWDQVQDFKWLKAEHSPNWSLLAPEDMVPDETWRDIVPGGPGWSLDDILKAVGVHGLGL